ncbi:MAG: site-specific integrase [Casimicrobiaceae bacterium]
MKSDPTRDLRGALKPVNHERYAALTAKELPEFLQRLESNDARLYLQTRLALRLLILTFVRTGELIGARWSEIDLDAAEWRIPPERMKMREGLIVPLSRQALATLLKMRTLSPDRDLVFPNQARPDAPMSNNTMLFAIGRMGYRGKATGHGFRATASTILNEHGFSRDAIERQLAHAERNKSRDAYNRALYLPERRKMMQHWADYLDGIAAGANVSGARLHVVTA